MSEASGEGGKTFEDSESTMNSSVNGVPLGMQIKKKGKKGKRQNRENAVYRLDIDESNVSDAAIRLLADKSRLLKMVGSGTVVVSAMESMFNVIEVLHEQCNQLGKENTLLEADIEEKAKQLKVKNKKTNVFIRLARLESVVFGDKSVKPRLVKPQSIQTQSIQPQYSQSDETPTSPVNDLDDSMQTDQTQYSIGFQQAGSQQSSSKRLSNGYSRKRTRFNADHQPPFKPPNWNFQAYPSTQLQPPIVQYSQATSYHTTPYPGVIPMRLPNQQLSQFRPLQQPIDRVEVDITPAQSTSTMQAGRNSSPILINDSPSPPASNNDDMDITESIRLLRKESNPEKRSDMIEKLKLNPGVFKILKNSSISFDVNS